MWIHEIPRFALCFRQVQIADNPVHPIIDHRDIQFIFSGFHLFRDIYPVRRGPGASGIHSVHGHLRHGGEVAQVDQDVFTLLFFGQSKMNRVGCLS